MICQRSDILAAAVAFSVSTTTSGKATLLMLAAALTAATQRAGNGLSNPTDAGAVLERYSSRREAIELFIASYRQYCWPVNSLDDLKLAPFHLMATEGKVHVDHDHTWHMDTLAEFCRHEPRLLMATPLRWGPLCTNLAEGSCSMWVKMGQSKS